MTIKWNNTEKDIQFYNLNDIFKKLSFIDSIYTLLKNTQVIINKECFTKISKHLKTSNHELGGLLLGSIYSNNNNIFDYGIVHIYDSIPSVKFTNSGVSLKMEPEVWTLATKKSNNHKYVLGWYHSHPNLGAFFSGTDRSTQKKFFNNTYNIGLVIDSINDEFKIFINEDSLELDKKNILITNIC